ncbi:nucleolar protein dao-5-like [Ischnura elegans]|uniref:nucleolar protein dao-5-like n=1 Tax=Ischnura elegans TaxID=197161 RepID=UPI001ED870F4|nr:nucleolar protein dao-5-like [Ischnura elegans]
MVREEWQRNNEITTNVISFFCCFSIISPLHHILLNYKIGSLCLEIIRNALRQYKKWEQELMLAKPIVNLPALCEEIAALSIQEPEQSASHQELELKKTTAKLDFSLLGVSQGTTSHEKSDDQALHLPPKLELKKTTAKLDLSLPSVSQGTTSPEKSDDQALHPPPKEQESSVQGSLKKSDSDLPAESNKGRPPPSPTPAIIPQKDNLPPLQERNPKVQGKRSTKKGDLGLPPLPPRASSPPPSNSIKPIDDCVPSRPVSRKHSLEGKKQKRMSEPTLSSPSNTESTLPLGDSLPSHRKKEGREARRKSDPSIPAASLERPLPPLSKPSTSLRDILLKQRELNLDGKKSTRGLDSSLPPISRSGPPRPPTPVKFLDSLQSHRMQEHKMKERKLIGKSVSDIPQLSDEQSHPQSPTLPPEFQFDRSPSLRKLRERRLEEKKPMRKSDPCVPTGFRYPCPSLTKPSSSLQDVQHKGGKSDLDWSLPPLVPATTSAANDDERSPSSEQEHKMKERKLIGKSVSDIPQLSDEQSRPQSPTLPPEFQFDRSPSLRKLRERRLEGKKPMRKSDPCVPTGFGYPRASLTKPSSSLQDVQHKGGKSDLDWSLPPLVPATTSAANDDERSPSSEFCQREQLPSG